MNDLPAYAIRIKALRLLSGLTQEELADRSGVSQNAISRYERGKNDPTGASLGALARELRTTSDYILGRTDDPSPLISLGP